ncbi:MAG: NAD-dependent succinate-semialdehyde dehydrogenase [Ignavibacteriaceae bacterium]|jgi:succinate-semialdehyde dehydrogenase/glutarate-semialdehyde dehydrogenase
MIYSIDPTTEEIIAEYEEYSDEKILRYIEKAEEAYQFHHRLSLDKRIELMLNAALILEKQKEALSHLMTLEMGKPIAQSRAEVEKCVWLCKYYCENAEHFLADEIISTDASKSYVSFQPLGIILAVMPWNFPFWQVFRFAVPNLLAGNACLLKHSSNVSGTALAIEKIFRDAGFAENLFGTLLISSSKVKQVIEHPFVKAVTLTGSTPAGKSVATIAGNVLKKSVLELGGSDPYIILEDADLVEAAKTCVTSRLINGGQSCIAAKRFIIVEKIFDHFQKLFVEQMKLRKMGNPFDATVSVGPQARIDLRNELQAQVEQSVEQGAVILLGGFIPEGDGAFYPPTVLTNVDEDNIAFQEEIFGPVAPLIKAKNEDDAIRLANKTVFGLGAAIFTKDLDKGEKIAKEKLLAGSCFINSFVKSDPRLPFGGINQSGYGRELGLFGIREFVNIKTIYVS